MRAEPGRRLADFAGAWRIDRQVIHADGTQARMTGEACWRPSRAGLDYVETGLLKIAGQPPVRAERRYIWHPDLTVYFDDGRLFHRVPATGGAVAHWCDPDRYEGLYDFSAWPAFEVSWVVTGPRKRYRMHTNYRPVPR